MFGGGRDFFIYFLCSLLFYFVYYILKCPLLITLGKWMQHVIVDVAWGDFLDFHTYKLAFYSFEIGEDTGLFLYESTFKYTW